MHGWGEGKAVFLVKINLPPFYSLLLLFVHAFLSYAPLYPHFPPSLYFPPLSFSLFLAPQPYWLYTPTHLGGGGLRWMREKDSEGIEGLLSHLFCVAMGYIFQCMHSAGKLPQIKVKCGSFIVFPACSGWFKSQGRNFTEVQSFIPSLYLSRRE